MLTHHNNSVVDPTPFITQAFFLTTTRRRTNVKQRQETAGMCFLTLFIIDVLLVFLETHNEGELVLGQADCPCVMFSWSWELSHLQDVLTSTADCWGSDQLLLRLLKRLTGSKWWVVVGVQHCSLSHLTPAGSSREDEGRGTERIIVRIKFSPLFFIQITLLIFSFIYFIAKLY